MELASMNLLRFTILALSMMVPALHTATAIAQDAAVGERLFNQRCAACHTLEAGQNRVGPHLNGIIGRQAGSVEGASYSQGMRALDMTWTPEQLNAYLAAPRDVVTGTTMPVSVPNEDERADIVAYLESLSVSE